MPNAFDMVTGASKDEKSGRRSRRPEHIVYQGHNPLISAQTEAEQRSDRKTNRRKPKKLKDCAGDPCPSSRPRQPTEAVLEAEYQHRRPARDGNDVLNEPSRSSPPSPRPLSQSAVTELPSTSPSLAILHELPDDSDMGVDQTRVLYPSTIFRSPSLLQYIAGLSCWRCLAEYLLVPTVTLLLCLYLIPTFVPSPREFSRSLRHFDSGALNIRHPWSEWPGLLSLHTAEDFPLNDISSEMTHAMRTSSGSVTIYEHHRVVLSRTALPFLRDLHSGLENQNVTLVGTASSGLQDLISSNKDRSLDFKNILQTTRKTISNLHDRAQAARKETVWRRFGANSDAEHDAAFADAALYKRLNKYMEDSCELLDRGLSHIERQIQVDDACSEAIGNFARLFREHTDPELWSKWPHLEPTISAGFQTFTAYYGTDCCPGIDPIGCTVRKGW